MKREITLKFKQEIPPEYVDNRKSLKDASEILVKVIKNEFNFDGEIEIVETKEFD